MLGFPFIFRGALDVRARAINEEMKVAAAYALANLTKEDVPDSVLRAYGVDSLKLGPDYIIPKPFDPRVMLWVSPAVAKAAMETGVARKMIDMLGSIFFMMPMAVVIWLYGWYFLWRHLVTPKPSASDTLERLLLKARALRWNVETISFSPNGFNAYFLFKVLLVAFAGLVFLQAIAFFYRSYLERKEGPESEGRYLDKDTLGEGEEIYEGTH